jgi:hypothetical protein
MMSPAFSSKYVERLAMISGTFQMRSSMSDCWRVSPLTVSLISPELMWPHFSTGVSGPQGQE